jgi:uncharacterized protein YcbX
LISITQLNIYPVKSCAGIALHRARLTPTGFAHDREWMIVRPDGRFVTQREQPRLALIQPELGIATLTLRAPDTAPLIVPLGQSEAAVEVSCWRDLCAAFDSGEEAARWLSNYLGEPHRLVHFDKARPRPSDPKWTAGLAAFNQFSDGFPWLIISEASLADLNARLPQPVPMNRFRPNIVVAGTQAYDEDRMVQLQSGSVVLRVVKGCTRCVITTTDQRTALRDGKEPLRTLQSYRMDRQLKGVVFGQNAIALAGINEELSVGDTLSVQWQGAGE